MPIENLKKIGLVGIFEDYQKRSTGPSFLLTPGYEYQDFKRKLSTALWDFKPVTYVHDSYYVHPAATTFGANQLNTALSYLYTSLATALERASHGNSVLVFQSALDLYAEIVINHRRQKWLEPLIEREVKSYDMLVYVAYRDQEPDRKNPVGAEHYDIIIRKLIQHFKGQYTQVKSVDEAATAIRSLFAA